LEAALRRPSADAPAEGTPMRQAARAEPAPTPPAKTSFENLEDEMASLLGRPKSSQ
ncbi:MAG: flagellar biosynthesis protein FliO, partial [Bradyrhizobium sp.]|nr:flagellar biosynthesis protein FliO [Bradyrhizobium sp.]